LHNHARHDDTVIIVPKWYLKKWKDNEGKPGFPGGVVHEPVVWGFIPVIVRAAQYWTTRWIASRGIPNEPHVREAVAMYKLRCLEQDQTSLHIGDICET